MIGFTRTVSIPRQLRAYADPERARHAARFFKTAPGEYGAGDRFLGIPVPVLRKLVREHREVPASAALELLRSEWHEQRLLALLLLVARFDRGSDPERRTIYRGYVAAIPHYVNNWDLVDTTAPAIVGGYLESRSHRPLYTWARSRNVWKRRVAVLATLRFIKHGSYDDTLALAEQLLDDRHDLIHKGTGWMLREVGNRDRAVLERFLRQHHARMPRTMLRYAIERLPARARVRYLTRA